MNSGNVGALGEEVACRYLEEKGMQVIERNFKRGIGEIDIIAKKSDVIHFVEVKSFSREMSGHRPEDNVHRRKLQKVKRTGELYMLERGIGEVSCQIDVVCIIFDQNKRTARCRILENV